MMSSSNHPTSNVEEALSSMNNTSVSLGSTSSNSSRDSIIPSVFPTFYKDVQAFYAKESPIPSPAPITPSVILTPTPVLFDPRIVHPVIMFVLQCYLVLMTAISLLHTEANVLA
ncbi:hypothetical protein Tco_1310437 [Tanacetum coccineum]